jgi:hypothetical protein
MRISYTAVYDRAPKEELFRTLVESLIDLMSS